MNFSAADIESMLNAMGDTVTIIETGVIYDCLYNEAGKMVQHYDGSIITTGPTITVSAATAALIVENTTYLQIGDQVYIAIAKTPDGAGMVDIELTRDYQ